MSDGRMSCTDYRPVPLLLYSVSVVYRRKMEFQAFLRNIITLQTSCSHNRTASSTRHIIIRKVVSSESTTAQESLSKFYGRGSNFAEDKGRRRFCFSFEGVCQIGPQLMLHFTAQPEFLAMHSFALEERDTMMAFQIHPMLSCHSM